MKNRLVSPKLVTAYGAIIVLILFCAVLGNRAITAVSSQIPIKDRCCVIVDAGHGGVDGGATSCTGVLESGMNLEIAIRLNDLMHLIGLDTKMIRTTDISVYTKGETIAAKKVSDLKNRVNTVNETENAILISIHQNHFTDSRYSGAQVFYGTNNEGRNLAKEVQEALVTNINKGSNRRIKKADGIYLLQNVDCPAILIECGFISNPQEEALLRDPIHQKKLCVVIAATTSQFLHDHTAS